MLFIVRGKNKDHDRLLRVHAETAQEAEAIGFKRGLFVTEVTPIENGSPGLGRLDKVAEMVWKAWKLAPKNPLKCFGRSVSNKQVAALMMLGSTTWLLNLRAIGAVQF
jgi:hypothetical protein